MRNEPLTAPGDTHAYERQQPLPQKVPILNRKGRQEVGRDTKTPILEYFLPAEKRIVPFLSPVTILPIPPLEGSEGRDAPTHTHSLPCFKAQGESRTLVNFCKMHNITKNIYMKQLINVNCTKRKLS